MSPSELEELLYREPFQPLRLTLSSGDQIVVREEDKPMVSNLALILRGTPMHGRIQTGHRLVSLPNIALVEMIPNRPATGRRRG